jgi:hypothetical protein
MNFVDFLGNDLDVSQQQTFQLWETLHQRIRDEIASTPRLHTLTTIFQDNDYQTYDRLIKLCQILIWIVRDKSKPQPDLFGHFSQEELDSFLLKSELRSAAELFISKEGKIPYYFGEDRLISLSSGNVEQILRIAGRLFDRIISNTRLRRGDVLSPADQDFIIRATAKEYWTELSRSLYKSMRIKTFLEIVGRFCSEQTYRLSAPYAPGVTGIALSISDYEFIANPSKTKIQGFVRLAELLRECIGFNIFEMNREPISCKGKEWRVLYLNRLLCVYFDLPLLYGGFREQKLKTLVSWSEGNAVFPKKQEKLF